MKINVFKTVNELIPAVAGYFSATAQDSISSRGEFNVALSGGISPKKLYEMLASPEFEKQIDWDKINFFFGDERNVPKDDPENNALMVRKVLFDPLKISESRIFAVDTTLPPQEASKRYMSAISHHFGDQKIRFDLILLGLGDDAHTASLFPYTAVLKDESASIKAVYVEQKDLYRITMTAPLINQARHIAFLVFGNAKSKAVYHVLENGSDPEKYPAQLIHPENGDLQWFLDETAASGLQSVNIQ
ncbi:MAG TPA: 6-phosphogluconolactonase [Chryseosolibacter sp.]